MYAICAFGVLSGHFFHYIPYMEITWSVWALTSRLVLCFSDTAQEPLIRAVLEEDICLLFWLDGVRL